MKLRKIMLGIASVGLASALPALADCGTCGHEGHKSETTATTAGYKEHKSDANKMTSSRSEVSAKSIRLSKLMNASATTKSGNRLGELKDLLIDPQSGKIEFAVLGKVNTSGAGQDNIPVPWKAISLESERQFTINVDPQKFESAPKMDSQYSNLDDPNYAITIYRFYAIPAAAMGGSESLEGAEQGKESSSSSSSATDTQDESEKSADSSSTY